MDIKPIRDEQDHADALAEIQRLWSAAKPGTPEGDKFDVLATLVDAYEREHYPIDQPSPIEAIKFAIDQGRFTRADLVKVMGSTAKVTEVLKHQRALSKAMIVRLHHLYAIPYEALLSDIERAEKKTKAVRANRAKAVHATRAKNTAKKRRTTSKRRSHASALHAG
jgi:Predicted transcription regulator containing HTH domain